MLCRSRLAWQQVFDLKFFEVSGFCRFMDLNEFWFLVIHNKPGLDLLDLNHSLLRPQQEVSEHAQTQTVVDLAFFQQYFILFLFRLSLTSAVESVAAAQLRMLVGHILTQSLLASIILVLQLFIWLAYKNRVIFRSAFCRFLHDFLDLFDHFFFSHVKNPFLYFLRCCWLLRLFLLFLSHNSRFNFPANLVMLIF